MGWKNFLMKTVSHFFYYCRKAGMLLRDLKLFCRLRTGRVQGGKPAQNRHFCPEASYNHEK